MYVYRVPSPISEIGIEFLGPYAIQRDQDPSAINTLQAAVKPLIDNEDNGVKFLGVSKETGKVAAVVQVHKVARSVVSR